MPHQRLRATLAILQVFIGLNAVGGGLALLFEWFPSSWLPRTWLRGSPFRSYRLPGAFLACIIGGGNLVGAVLVLRRHTWGPVISLVNGLVLSLWIGVQVAIIGLRLALQPLMFVVGGVVAALAGWLYRMEHRRQPPAPATQGISRRASALAPRCHQPQRSHPGMASWSMPK